MNDQRLFDSRVDSDSIKQWRAQGKKAMGVICGHVPEEIFHAAGVLPVRLRATDCADSSQAETWMSPYSCSFARSCLQYLLDGTYDLDGVVASDGCLQALRILDNWMHICGKKPNRFFFREIGAPRKLSPTTIGYYKGELEILRDQLAAHLGVTITDEKIKQSVAVYNESRALIRQLYELRKAN